MLRKSLWVDSPELAPGCAIAPYTLSPLLSFSRRRGTKPVLLCLRIIVSHLPITPTEEVSMSCHRKTRLFYLGSVVTIMFLGSCSIEKEMRTSEKQENVPIGQASEPKAPVPVRQA